jgi:hypothetical protein
MLLDPFLALGKVPGAIQRAYDGANEAVLERFTAVFKQWYDGDWRAAAKEFGKIGGQTAGDLGASDLIVAKALALLPRFKLGVKLLEREAALRQRVTDAALRGLGRTRTTARQALRFLRGKIKPGYLFGFDQLGDLFGLSVKQGKKLAAYARKNRLIIVARSRAAESLKWIADGARLKPQWIKLKTVNAYDVKYLGYREKDIGRLIVKTPPPQAEFLSQLAQKGLGPGDIEYEKALSRWTKRTEEFANTGDGYVQQMQEWNKAGEVKGKWPWSENGVDPSIASDETYTAGFQLRKEFDENGVEHFVVEVDPRGQGAGGVKGFESVTGDVDLIKITRADGTALTDEEHVRILREMRADPDLDFQHPETSTWTDVDGSFDFPEKRRQLIDDGQIQVEFGPDGRARAVKFDTKSSDFTDRFNYRSVFEGGYQHMGTYFSSFLGGGLRGATTQTAPGRVTYGAWKPAP